MNKRDFLLQGSGALLGSAVWTGAGARAASSAQPAGIATDTSKQAAAQGSGPLQAWQALRGERFEAATALGRPVSLVLAQVLARPGMPGGLCQFTLTFTGPKGLPLVSGLHALHHEPTGTAALHLEPVRQGQHMRYLAHFSLLA